LRILHVVQSGDGGAARQVLTLSRNLKRNGYNITVVCSDDGFLVRELQHSNIEVISGSWLGKKAFAKALVSVALQRKFDIIHLHGTPAGFLGGLIFGLSQKSRIVYTERGWAFDFAVLYKPRFYYYIRNWLLEKIACTCAQAVVAVSKGDFKSAVSQHIVSKKKLNIIYNGVDISLFSSPPQENLQSLRSEVDWDNGKLYVITVSRLHPQKSVDLFIEAANLIVKNGQRDLQFIIVGDGEEREELERLVDELNIKAYVHFWGFRDNIPAVLSMADLFVLTSCHEGLPNVILEALASRTPVVATDVPGTREVIKDGVNGLLVPYGNPTEIATAISVLLSSEEKRHSLVDAGWQIVNQKFSATNTAERIESLYSQIHE
jgi:glycosyltransferase involved in cell wall biosynthesis